MTSDTRGTGASEAGTLYVVGTPIGNLEDLSPRGARVLGEVILVAAEDTRRTQALLTHLGIRKPLIAVYAEVERSRSGRVLEALTGGDVALCTDGGMPAISDPGAFLVNSARAAGHVVVVIPGPTAVASALAASGFSADRFIFLGFLPRKQTQMTAAFLELEDERRTVVAYESPHRLLKALDTISTTLADRRVAVARELTKVHEEVRVATAEVLAAHYREHPPRGEVTIVIEGRPRSPRTT
ncbi:MAG: 16S rRNA (cytidine(1402)-2'-O)-methyltransferase [Candidatus Dormibacteria bacterium]